MWAPPAGPSWRPWEWPATQRCGGGTWWFQGWDWLGAENSKQKIIIVGNSWGWISWRTSLIAVLVACLDGHFAIENPASSWITWQPRLLEACKKLKNGGITVIWPTITAIFFEAMTVLTKSLFVYESIIWHVPIISLSIRSTKPSSKCGTLGPEHRSLPWFSPMPEYWTNFMTEESRLSVLRLHGPCAVGTKMHMVDQHIVEQSGWRDHSIWMALVNGSFNIF